jgi:hypothetical protein
MGEVRLRRISVTAAQCEVWLEQRDTTPIAIPIMCGCCSAEMPAQGF